MLIASLGGERIEASTTLERNPDYVCPECKQTVILKAGEIKIAHFAHKVKSDCLYAINETLAHLTAKRLFCDGLRSRGIRAEVEFTIGDQRADVAAWTPKNQLFVIEVQHTSLPVSELSSRVKKYRAKGIPQLWVPFLRKQIFDYQGYKDKRHIALLTGQKYVFQPYRVVHETVVTRYAIRPFERWLGKVYGQKLYYYDEQTTEICLGTFEGHTISGSSEWFDEFGQDQYSEYEYYSRRWKTLNLSRFYEIAKTRFKLTSDMALGVELIFPEGYR